MSPLATQEPIRQMPDAAGTPSRPIRVAFLLQDFHAGGIVRWIDTYCHQLHRSDPGRFEFHFVCTHSPTIQPQFARIGTPKFIGRPGKEPNWRVWRQMTAYVRQLDLDVILFCNLKGYRDVAVRVRPPVIIARMAGSRSLNRFSLKGMSAVFSQNRSVMPLIDFDPTRVFLMYAGVDLAELDAVTPNRLGFADDDFIIGQSSRLGEAHNQRLLIDAVRRLRARHPQVKLVIVGGTTSLPGTVDLLPALREYAADLGEHAKFLGHQDDPLPFIAGFDVGTCTSTRAFTEGAPRKLVEPMAMGIPCVTTDSGATDEVVDDGENGFVVEDGDLDAFTDRLERLLRDRALYARYAQRAREKIETTFNLVTQAERFKQILLQLLREAPVRS